MDNLSEILESWQDFREEERVWERTLKIPRPEPDFITILQGVRRSGKSTYLQQLPKIWNIPLEQCIFVNFEDPRLLNQLDYTLLDEIKATNTKMYRYFFFDEIQSVLGWQNWLRMQVDQAKSDHYIITGSNAALLSGELGSTLTGRHISFELFPMSYTEQLAMKPETLLEDYIRKGGFPRVLRANNPEQILRQYFIDIIERDLRNRLGAKTLLPLQRLVKTIFESVGSELSLRKLAAQIGSSVDTVQHYLEAAESAYLVFCCPFFTYSERSRSYRNKKYYAVDTGLRRSVVTKSGSDMGKDFENCVFLELRKQHKNVFYWSGKGEVDFVIESQNGLQPIQVTWGEVHKRHETALEDFYREFPSALEPIFITKDNFVLEAFKF